MLPKHDLLSGISIVVSPQKCTKIVTGRAPRVYAPDPAGGDHDAPSRLSTTGVESKQARSSLHTLDFGENKFVAQTI